MSKTYELQQMSQIRENQNKRQNQNQQDEQQPLVIRQYRFRSFNGIAIMILNICLSSFYFGFTMQYLGTFDFHVIRELYHINFDQKSAAGLYNGCVPIGAAIGSMCTFLLLRLFSRKYSLLVVNVIAFIFGLLLFIKNPYSFFICRLMQGICTGFYSVISPLIIKQLAPIQIAGTLGSMNQLIIAFGCFFACLLQLLLKLLNGHQQNYYYIMFGFTLVTLIVQTFTLLTIFRSQTPKYLLQNNREQECIKLLSQIYLQQYVQQVLRQKKIDIGLIEQNQNKYTGLNQIQTINKQQKVSVVIKQKRNKLRLIVSIHLAMLQQFVGCNAIVIYGTQIASQILPTIKNVIPVILNLQQTLAALATGYLLTRYGRKQILQRGTAGCVIALLAVTLGFYLFDKGDKAIGGFLIVMWLIIFMAVFGLSLGPIVWLYIPEILQPELISVSTLTNWSSASFIVISFPIFKQILGSSAYLFFFYALYAAFGFFFNQKYVIETHGKTQKQIYDQYQKLSSS